MEQDQKPGLPVSAHEDAGHAGAGHRAPGHTRSSLCRNCGVVVNRNYCPECGQDTSLHPLSVWEFFHEFVSHYVAVEGKLWKTLLLLSLQPGRLTREYLAGRRQRYIQPLRLYLTASFLFFFFSQWHAHEHVKLPAKTAASAGTPAAGAAAPAGNPAPQSSDDADEDNDPDTDVQDAAMGPARAGQGNTRAKEETGVNLKLGEGELTEEHFEECLAPGNHCGYWKRHLAPQLVELDRHPQQAIERLLERFRHSLSYAMFAMLPVFAMLLALVYRRRPFFYGEHLVFALHLHSFWFFLGLLLILVPKGIADWAILPYLLYGFWAMHRVYGGRWRPTIARGLLVSVLYLLCLGAGAGLLGLALLLT